MFLLVLGLATSALYQGATRCDFINYDDHYYVTSNTEVQKGLTWETVKYAFSSIVSSNWHPLTMLSHMLDCQLFGLNPRGHHLTSVLLHTFNTVLVFVWLRNLTGKLWQSLLVAVFFGWHPLRVESVTWVAERKDVLSVFFGLLCLIFYCRYVQNRISKPEPSASDVQLKAGFAGNANSDYVLALGFLVLGLLSKPMLVTWPAVMLFLDYWPFRRFNRSTTTSLIWEKAPFIILAVLSGILTFLVQQKTGATEMLENISLEGRVENALVSYIRYLQKIIWPKDLSVFYPMQIHWPLPVVFIAGVLMVAISWLCWVSRLRYGYLLMGWLWYCVTLIPVIGLIQVGEQSMADRYTYLPSLGLLIAITWGGFDLFSRWEKLTFPSLGGAAVAILICAVLTRSQIGFWQDSETLFRHALAVTNDNYFAHYCLGNALESRGNLEEAVSEFREAIRLKPAFTPAHVNLGQVFKKEGNIEEAIQEFRETVNLEPNNGAWHFNLGLVLVKSGKMDEAINEFREAVRLMPSAAECHTMLGLTLESKGFIDEAIVQLQEAVRLKPEVGQFHDNLGAAYELKGRTKDAVNEYQTALHPKW